MRSSRAWRPGRPLRGPAVPVDVYASAAVRGGRAAAGVVIRSAGRTLRVLGRAVPAGSRDEAAYRAVLQGIWRARATGARHLRVHVDAPAVAAQLRGTAEVPPELIGLYLQTRAMLNAWRWSSVEAVRRAENADAALAALEALDQEPAPADFEDETPERLPLWESAEAAPRRE